MEKTETFRPFVDNTPKDAVTTEPGVEQFIVPKIVESSKIKKVLGLILGGTAGGAVGALDATIGYDALPPQIAQQMTDLGFTFVSLDGNTISYSGVSLDVPATWNEQEQYWDLENKINLGSTLVTSNVVGGVAAGSVLLIPLYFKKNPTLAAMHALLAGGVVIGNSIKHARLENLSIYSQGLKQTWTVQGFATERPGVAGTNPALFGLDEAILGVYLVALGVVGLKMGFDYRKARLPSEAVKGYNQDALGVNETF